MVDNEIDDDDHGKYNFINDFLAKNNLTYSAYAGYGSYRPYRANWGDYFEFHHKNISRTTYWLQFSTDFTNVFLIPCTIIVSFLLNVICISIFTSSNLKSTFYKYLSANSINDCITLMVALLSLFVYSDTYSAAQYFFVYLSFTSLTISNLLKIALSLDRIFRLSKMCKWYVKKTSFKWILAALVVFSAGINSPKLIFSDLYSNSWQKSNILTLTLNPEGSESKIKGPLLIISTILIEIIPYIAVLALNVVLLSAVKDHLKSLVKIEDASGLDADGVSMGGGGNEGQTIIVPRTINRMKQKRVHFDIYDEDDSDEETADVVVIANIESDSAIDGMSQASSKEDSMEVTMEKKEKKENIDQRTDIEITRFSLTKMLQLSYIVYILGHSLFVFSSIFIQVKYFFNFGPLMNVFKQHMLVINLIIAISYLFLYISFGANFFVYFAFNGLFRKMLSKTTKKNKEDGDEENGEEGGEDSIAQNF
jgi:hypothetical protein